jgi:DNA-binding NarL/FixJ family response regulator
MKMSAIAADDHSIVLAGLRSVLQESGCHLLETVPDGRALVAAAERLNPDLIFLDISMPILNGIEAARQIRAKHSRAKLIFLSMHTDLPYVREAFQAGGNAYVLKSAAAFELGTALNEVMKGHRYVSPAVSEESVETLLAAPAVNSFGRELNPRHREILQLVAEGKTNKEIAEALHISVKTVEYHKANLMSALGLRTTAELTKYAMQQKMTGD